MTPLLAFVALLTIGFYVPAPAQGALTQLKKVTRKALGPKTYQLIAEYDSGIVPAKWYLNEQEINATTTAGKSWTIIRNGLSSFVVLLLILGDESTQCLHVVWSLVGHEEQSTVLNFDLSTVDPGLTVEYTAGQRTNVYIKTPERRGNGNLISNGLWAGPYGKYLIDGTKQVREVPPVIQETGPVTENHISTITWTFFSNEPIVGYFWTSVRSKKLKDTSLIRRIDERIAVMVHEPGRSVPFEAGYMPVDHK